MYHKSKTGKRVLAAILAMGLLLGASACQQAPPSAAAEESQEASAAVKAEQEGVSEVKNQEQEGDRNVVAKEQTGQGTVGTEEDGPFGRYKEPLTIEFVRTTDATADEKINKLSAAWDGQESWEDNRWIRLFQDELNIEVKYRWIVNTEQYAQKWKMSMASGDIPDVSKVDLIDLNHLADAGMIQDMGPYWDKYVNELTQSVVTADGTAVYDAIKVDGKMMGVPQVMAALDNYCYLWLRTDWMKKLDIEAPKTMEDFNKMLESFVTQDPDGNGKDDTYAMMFDKTLWYELEGFFWGYNAYPDTWLKAEDGSLVYGAIQPEMLKPLQTLQQMYNDGWLDKEFVVKDYLKANEMIAAGKTGVSSGGHWLPYDLAKSRENDPNADWGCFPWPTETGKPVVGELELGLRNTLAVKSGFEHPEAIIKMLNLYYEKLYGGTGDYSYWGNDRKTGVDGVWSMGPLDTFHPLINVIPYRDAVKVVNGEMQEGELKGASLDYYNNGKEMWEWERMWMPGNRSAGDLIEQVLEEKRVFTDNFIGASTPTMVERWAQMKELTDTTFTKIITGQLEAKEGFENFVKDWKKIGGDQITKEVNEWYDTNVK